MLTCFIIRYYNRHSIHMITFLVHVVTYIMLKFLINTVDCSVIYDERFLGNVATYVFHYSFIRNIKHCSVCFNASNKNMDLLSNSNMWTGAWKTNVMTFAPIAVQLESTMFAWRSLGHWLPIEPHSELSSDRMDDSKRITSWHYQNVEKGMQPDVVFCWCCAFTPQQQYFSHITAVS